MNETSVFSLCFSKYFRDPGYQERIVEENLFVKMYGLGVPACLPAKIPYNGNNHQHGIDL